MRVWYHETSLLSSLPQPFAEFYSFSRSLYGRWRSPQWRRVMIVGRTAAVNPKKLFRSFIASKANKNITGVAVGRFPHLSPLDKTKLNYTVGEPTIINSQYEQLRMTASRCRRARRLWREIAFYCERDRAPERKTFLFSETRMFRHLEARRDRCHHMRTAIAEPLKATHKENDIATRCNTKRCHKFEKNRRSSFNEIVFFFRFAIVHLLETKGCRGEAWQQRCWAREEKKSPSESLAQI